jgi:hypothetical protein
VNARMEALRWRVAVLADRWLPCQCWADLVMWAMRDRADNEGAGIAARLPWQPIRKSCYEDAERAGRCYCGTIGSDGTVLRRGEYVCTASMPGRESDRYCSRPGGHDGDHRCGVVEWGLVR